MCLVCRQVSINGKQLFYSEKHKETFAKKMGAWKVHLRPC